MIPIGQRYFATRERLEEVARSVLALAKETGTKADSLDALESPVEGLPRPFRLVVCGEVNAGKSAFLNGLLELELCEVAPTPMTSRVELYRYGAADWDSSHEKGVKVRHRNLPVLKNFEVIDTPGTTGIGEEIRETLFKIEEGIDAWCVVVPASNPWTASIWDWAGKLPWEVLEKTFFAIQRADELDARDTEVLLGHLRELARQRLGIIPPVFPVSTARVKPGDAVARHASGFAEIDAYLTRTMCDSSERSALFDRWRKATASVLQAIDDRLEDQNRAIQADGRFLHEVEREIELLGEREMVHAMKRMNQEGWVLARDLKWMLRWVKGRAGITRAVLRTFFGDRRPVEIDEAFQKRMEERVAEIATTSAKKSREVCIAHWEHLGPKVKERFGIEELAQDEIQPTLDAASKRLEKLSVEAARKICGNLRLRGPLMREVRTRYRSLRVWLALVLGCLIVAGVTGGLKIPMIPQIAAAVAGVVALITLGIAWNARRNVVSVVALLLNTSIRSMEAELTQQHSERIRVFFRDYTRELERIRRRVAEGKLILAPRQKRWSECFLSLKSIEQDI